jgi:hypothetical protein
MDGAGDGIRTADFGFLNMMPVRVWLGPDITFVGRITSVNITHLLFTEKMIPKYSQIDLQIQRPITWGKDIASSYDNVNNSISKPSDYGIFGNTGSANQPTTPTPGTP